MSVAAGAKGMTGLGVIGAFLRSSVGAKVLMSLSGVIMWGFVIGHLAGNLQVLLPAPAGGYAGQQINEYAKFLHDTPPLLWGTRILVLASLIGHVLVGLRLARMNRAARPMRYAKVQYERSSISSRLMALSGLIVLAFILFHLAHFTFHWVDTSYATMTDKKGLHDVYGMLWQGFKLPGIVAFYVVGQALLFMHLYHGSVSFLQSLGLRHPAWTPVASILGRLLVIGILAGNVAIPTILIASWYTQGH